jgi:hypothetical protein
MVILMANIKKSPEKMIVVLAAISLLSSAILATTQGQSQLAFAQSANSMMNISSSSSLPQPNSNGTLLKVEGSNALFEPAAGLSNVFGPDVSQLYDLAFLYGHAKVTDITNGNNTDVAKDVFTHAMVAHVMDEKAYYCNLKDQAMSPTLVYYLV